MKVVWLCPYPVDILSDFGLKLTRPAGGHPCSWVINWAASLSGLPEVDLHIVTFSPRVKCYQSISFSRYTVHVVRDALPFTDRGVAGLFNYDARTSFRGRVKRLIRVVKLLQPDLVHGHGTEDAYALAAVMSGFTAVISIQGIMAEYLKTNPSSRYCFTSKTERRAVELSDYFMCRTHFDKSFVRQCNQSAKIFHMPEPMNPCFFCLTRKESEPKRILYVGGFNERKGLDDLLKAVVLLKPKFPSCRIDVIGGGEEARRKLLVSKAKELGVFDMMKFHGFLESEKIAELHQQATLFVITSRNENSPNTLAEALCAGTPSVAYDVGGISSMFVDGESGFLVPPSDFETLAKKMMQLMGDAELRQRFSEKASRDGNQNLPENVAERCVQCYTEILNEC